MSTAFLFEATTLFLDSVNQSTTLAKMRASIAVSTLFVALAVANPVGRRSLVARQSEYDDYDYDYDCPYDQEDDSPAAPASSAPVPMTPAMNETMMASPTPMPVEPVEDDKPSYEPEDETEESEEKTDTDDEEVEGYGPASGSWADNMLAAHNRARALHPNTAPLTWSNRLARAAEMDAAQCGGHS